MGLGLWMKSKRPKPQVPNRVKTIQSLSNIQKQLSKCFRKCSPNWTVNSPITFLRMLNISLDSGSSWQAAVFFIYWPFAFIFFRVTVDTDRIWGKRRVWHAAKVPDWNQNGDVTVPWFASGPLRQTVMYQKQVSHVCSYLWFCSCISDGFISAKFL